MQYPDLSTGSASPYQQEVYCYDAAGEAKSYQTRNLVAHAYSYDALGRLTLDVASIVGTNTYRVDMGVDRLAYAYDSAGHLSAAISKDGSTFINEVDRTYNGFGQVTEEDQMNGSVTYTYSTPDPEGSGLNASRLTGMNYGHETLGYVYNSGVDASISRLSGITGSALSNGSTVTLEGYTYLGLSTVVARTNAEIGTSSLAGLTLIGATNGAAGDIYVGLDTFGRIADQRWNDGTGSAMEEFTYAYDVDSNPVARANALSAKNGEVYTYDALDRLTSFARQTVAITGTTVPTITATGTASATQSRDYDSLGNWATMSFNGTPSSSTFSAQNQLITNGATSSTLAYDANGNQTTDENGDTLTYDAWNRMVLWTPPPLGGGGEELGTGAVTYTYDALGRRLSLVVDNGAEPPGGGVFVNSLAGQVLVEAPNPGGAEGSSFTEQEYIWSPVYVNAMVCRDTFDVDYVLDVPVGTLAERDYARQDANWNVTSIVTSTDGTTWSTGERYVYTPYGVQTILTGSFGSRGSSSYGWMQGFQGGFYDYESALVLFNCGGQGRIYETSTGTWKQQDAVRAGANVYQFVDSMPLRLSDPEGLQGGAGLPVGKGGMPQPRNRIASLIAKQLSPQGKSCPKCQQEADDLAKAIENEIYSHHGWQIGGGIGNWISGATGAIRGVIRHPTTPVSSWNNGAIDGGWGDQCGDWQAAMVAAIASVLAKYPNGCFQAKTEDGSNLGKPKDNTHNWCIIQGPGGYVDIDPWPSGGRDVVDSTGTNEYHGPDRQIREHDITGSPLALNADPCGSCQSSTRPSQILSNNK